jgi:hypothetical protein
MDDQILNGMTALDLKQHISVTGGLCLLVTVFYYCSDILVMLTARFNFPLKSL